MIDFERHFLRLQNAIGVKNKEGKNCADKIDEQLWCNEVMKSLNQASIDCADELQRETSKPYTKELNDGTKNYDLNYREATPT